MWHLDPSSRLATVDMGRKLWVVPPFWGELGAHLTQSGLGRGRTKSHLDPSSGLATIDMCRKLRAMPRAPLLGREMGLHLTHLTQCRLGRGIPSYQVASLSIQPFGHSRHGPQFIWTQVETDQKRVLHFRPKTKTNFGRSLVTIIVIIN